MAPRLPRHQHAKPDKAAKRQSRGRSLLGHVHQHLPEPGGILSPTQRGKLHPGKIPQFFKTPGIIVQRLLFPSLRQEPCCAVYGQLGRILRNFCRTAFKRPPQGIPKGGTGTQIGSHHAEHLLTVSIPQGSQAIHGAYDVRNSGNGFPVQLYGGKTFLHRLLTGYQPLQSLADDPGGIRQTVPVIQSIGYGPALQLSRHSLQIFRPCGNGFPSPFVRNRPATGQSTFILFLV